MEALKCFSLSGDKVTEGIAVDDFESIVTVTPAVAKIKLAVLQTLPVVSKCAQKGVSDYRRMAGISLSFIHEVTGKSPVSKAGVLLSVDTTKWRIAVDDIPAVIVDPCGLKNHVIIFVKAGSTNFLTSRDNANTFVSLNAKNAPEIQRINRGALMLSALMDPKQAVNRPTRSLVPSGKAADTTG